MAANENRGEVAITLAGKEFVLRPTFQCICEIEAQLGMGIMALAKRVSLSNFGMFDVAVVFTAGMKAGGDDGANLQKVGDMVYQDGLANFSTSMNEFLTMALGGPAKGKV